MVKFLLLSLVFLAGCVTPSTLMVNGRGQVVRCSAYGYGGLLHLAAAYAIRDQCVEDMKKLGFREMEK